MFIYDIFLKGTESLIADSGDEMFETEEEARADAHDLMISYLADEYGLKPKDFEVVIYESEN